MYWTLMILLYTVRPFTSAYFSAQLERNQIELAPYGCRYNNAVFGIPLLDEVSKMVTGVERVTTS